MIHISSSCPSADVVQVCRGHGICQLLEVDGLFPFKLLVSTVVDEDVRCVIPDQQLDLFKDVWDKALFVFGEKQFQLFLVWGKATDFIESASEPFDGFLTLAKFDDQAIDLGQVHWFLRSSHDLVCWS